MFDYERFAHLHDHWIDRPGYDLGHDFSEDEYELRISRARELMSDVGLDALVVTSSAIGSWFTSRFEPHEWHDVCSSRSAWYVLTETSDHLFMTPTAGGEHLNTTRRSTWVGQIGTIVERSGRERVELWELEQIPQIFSGMGLSRARIGFELGDCMTLGISVNDFLRLRELMPDADLTDASAVFRRLMSVHTPEEISRVRTACEAGVEMHACVGELLRPGMTERELFSRLQDSFDERFGSADVGFEYAVAGVWDVRNHRRGDDTMFHAVITDRPYRDGDLVFRGWSGVSYRGYIADVDRMWHLGQPCAEVYRLYQLTWESNRAMAAAIRPGATCADIYAMGAAVEKEHGMSERLTGRTGHGLRNTGGLSVSPSNHTILEPGMILSVEPMFATEYGFFDLEDQYVVTEVGADVLHSPAPEELPVIDA